MNSEILCIEITAISVSGSASFLDVVGGHRGTAQIGDGVDVTVGEVCTAEVDSQHHRLVRVLSVQSSPPDVDDDDDLVEEPVVFVNGIPIRAVFDPTPAAVGQVRIVDVPFTSEHTSDADHGTTSKRRPAVVVGITDYILALPIHGMGTYVARHGGICLEGWRELGLKKPSVVNPATILVAPDRLGMVVGELGFTDRRKLCPNCH